MEVIKKINLNMKVITKIKEMFMVVLYFYFTFEI